MGTRITRLSIERFENVWALLLEPGYVFTFDGRKHLLAPDRVNKLSTKRAARDYNSAVHNDLSFWAWVLAGGETAGTFSLELAGPARSEMDLEQLRPETYVPRILLSSRLPTIAVNDTVLLAGEPDERDDDPEMAELEADDQLANEERAKILEKQNDDRH